MFKREDEVVSFIDYLEDFIKAVVSNDDLSTMETVSLLNKKRANLEQYIIELNNISHLQTAEPDELKCPDCGSKMYERTNRTNGDKFWGCSKYPDCRGTRDSEGLSREERAAKREQSSFRQESGYSFNKKRNPVTEVGPE